MDRIIDTIKDAAGTILKDKKRLVRILSIILILLAAAVLKIHDSSKADIKIESSGSSAGTGQTEPAAEEAGQEIIFGCRFSRRVSGRA